MMVAPRPILKSLPLYTADTMKHTRTIRFNSDVDVRIGTADDLSHDCDNTDGDHESTGEAESITPPSPAFPFASTTHIPPFSPHVHFPPTPILTQMAMTHSSVSYDRKPIEVQPNELALPARGAREVDSEDDAESEMESEAGSDTEGEAQTGAYRELKKTRKTLSNGNGNEEGYFHLPSQPYDTEVMDSMDLDMDMEQETQERSCPFGSSSPRNSSSRSSSRRGSPKASMSKHKPISKASRPQTPYHHPSAFPSDHDSCFDDEFLPPPPPLVFDPSSESDSDLCISPGSGQSPDQVSHMHMSQTSLQLAGLASKLPLDSDEMFHDALTPAPPSLLTRKRVEDRHHSSRKDAKRHKSCGSKRARIAGGPDTGYRTTGSFNSGRSSNRTISTPSELRFGSSFYEGSLDGCLGGF